MKAMGSQGGDAEGLLRRRLPLLMAAGLSVWHFATYDIANLPLVTDTRYYLYFAWQMTEGAIPHLDFFDHKTQLSTFVGALLHALGSTLSLEPLLVVRAGFLSLAALAGVLIFIVHRRLFRGSAVAGLLGLLAYLSFGFIGALTAIGNSPKLLLSIFAYLMALCIWKRHWLLAGLLGALAFMDWQIGALVWIAALGTALFLERERYSACFRLVAGGVLGLTPFLIYFALNGALGAAFDQMVNNAFFRGSDRLVSVGVGDRVRRLAGMIDFYFPGRQWLLYLSALGIPCAFRHLRRVRGTEEGRLLLPLCLFHAGILAFSAMDFQAHGDFLLVLFTASFLLGMAWNVLFTEIEQRLAERTRPRWRPALAAALVLLALGASRPAVLRPEIVVGRGRWEGVRLQDQKEVAEEVRRWVGDRSLLLLDSTELLYLMRRTNPLPILYWNHGAWVFCREPGEESGEQTMRRMLEEVDAKVLAYPRRHISPIPYLEHYAPRRFHSRSGRYMVELLER